MRSYANTIYKLVLLIALPQMKLRKSILLITLLDLSTVIAGLAAPMILKRTVDELGQGATPAAYILIDVFLMIVASSLPILFAGCRQLPATRIVQTITIGLSRDSIANRLESVAFGMADASELAGALEKLPLSLQTIVDAVLGRLIPMSLQLSLTLVVISILSPVYALLFALTVCAYAIGADAGARRYKNAADSVNASNVRFTKVIGDITKNSRRIIFNDALSFELKNVGNAHIERESANLAMARTSRTMAVIQLFTLLLILASMLGLGAWDVIQHKLSVGGFILIQAFAVQLSSPLAWAGTMVRQSAVALTNVQDVLCFCKSQPSAPAKTILPSACNSGISVDGVSFSYGQVPVLNDISFNVEVGKLICVVGKNGSGKSTLLQLLSGKIPPDSGNIYVNGYPLRAPEGDSSKYALYVPQGITLLNRTIRENGMYPPSRLTERMLHQGLDALGFDTLGALDVEASVGDAGSKLSGGQIQKLEMVRLEGVSIPLLLLDETTSALDRSSRNLSIARLRAASTVTTVMLVTHDSELAALADEVIYLERGRLNCKGNHGELLATSASYRALWEY